MLVIVITYLATSPSPPRTVDFGLDKINHAVAFAVLGAVAMVGYGRAAWVRVVLWLLGFGIAIEIAQTQVPGRSAEAADLLADGVGIAIGLGIARILTARQRRQAGRQ